MFKTDSFDSLETFALKKVTPDFPVYPGSRPKLVLSFPTLLFILSHRQSWPGAAWPSCTRNQICTYFPPWQGTWPRCLVSQGCPSILFIQHFQLSACCSPRPGLSRATGCSSAAGMIHQLEPSLPWRVRDLKAVKRFVSY